MKLHQFAAIIVLLLSAAWILTGQFSAVGSAADTDSDSPNTVIARQTADEKEQGQTLQTVGVAQIPSSLHARSVRVSGITQSDMKTTLTARSSAVVSTISVTKGDMVSKDDVILTLAPEGRNAALASAKQSLEQAKIDADAKEKLVKNGTLPSQQLDIAMVALRAAESQVEVAKADVDRLTVKAAFDGVIDDISVEQGAAVQPGTPVATLISLDPIIGKGEVNESDLSIVKIGNEASLRLVDGSVKTGKIQFVSREAQANTRTYAVEIVIPNADFSIPSGMTSELILRGKPVLSTPVPRSVITLNNAGELGVRSVNNENKVVFHPIDIVDDSTGALILGGIPKDARIIVAGQNLVTEDQLVKPVEADKETINKLIAETSSQAKVQ